MENKNKKGISYKLQKNPFLLLLFVIVIAIALFAISTLITAVQKKVTENKETSEAEIITTTITETTKPQGILEESSLKRYSDTIKSVDVVKENDGVAVRVKYKDEATLLKEHFNSITEIVPVFYFYINNGTQVRCPGEFRILKDDTSVAVYILNNIDDLSNAVGLTDKKTVTVNNVLTSLKFNVCIEHKFKDGVIKTVVGTYAENVEEFNKKYAPKPSKIIDLENGIKKVDVTLTNHFVWLDIYFVDSDSYEKLNNNFENNFLSFGFTYGGNNYKRDFLVTKYDDIYMLRCKFDSYSLKELTESMGSNLSMFDIFENNNIAVWTSNYNKTTKLFYINGETNIIDSISKTVRT